MTDHPDFGSIEAAEAARLERLGDRLLAARPLPAPGFRGDLRRKLVAQPARPLRFLRLRAAACLTAGTALLLVATLGAVDIGPLAPTTTPSELASVAR